MTRILITAGPTREYIDDVRYLSNASSGRMGYAIARAAAREGHDVHLVMGPLELKPPAGIEITQVVSALEMEAAVRRAAQAADIVIMAAAVADWRPVERKPGKIKKRPGGDDAPALKLVRNPDILAGLGRRRRRRGQLLVGFALEAERLLEHGRAKMEAKRVDLLVANTVEAMGAKQTKLTILDGAGGVTEWRPMSKASAARKLVRLCVERHEARGGDRG